MIDKQRHDLCPFADGTSGLREPFHFALYGDERLGTMPTTKSFSRDIAVASLLGVMLQRMILAPC